MIKKIIQERERIFIAGEGESEQSFVKWLQQLSNQQGLHIHLDCETLEGGGYKSMLEKTLRERKRKERHRARLSILLVDSDRDLRWDDGWTLPHLKEQATKHNIHLCVQSPNLEGILFRMLPNNERLQKSATNLHTQLCKAWPNYQKPADARTLAAKFSLNDLIRAAKADPELNTFLTLLGFYFTQSRK